MSSPNTASRAALLLASGFGLGYLPIAPGTWGSFGGVVLYVLMGWSLPRLAGHECVPGSMRFLLAVATVNVLIALVGVWAARVAAQHLQQADPRVVVIDEVSGQLLTYVTLGSFNWKWLLAGFLLFRALDIWKPFPAKQMESWSGGWGIMADDWMAGAYAAAVLAAMQWATR